MRATVIRFAADLLSATAACVPYRVALTPAPGRPGVDYRTLAQRVQQLAGGLQQCGLVRHDRVAVWMDKRADTVTALFGAMAAGGVAVPVNPVARPAQVAHVLADSGAAVLVTTGERLEALAAQGEGWASALRTVVVAGSGVPASAAGPDVVPFDELAAACSAGPVCDSDPAALFYTSGSTGRPKGVVVSHRNLVVGATSVASYLENVADDVLLAVLPLAFDAGFSQLTTAFAVGARVVLLNHLLPGEVIKAVDTEGVTGLTAVPPLYIQMTQSPWPEGAGRSLRYFANTGGRMPLATLQSLRQRVPRAKPFLMYGLTEAFRSTYLPPEQVDRRPDSIGRAIPNAEVLVLREDGSECAPDEPGELVHRGPLVAQGYWGDPARTAERFRPLPPGLAARPGGLVLPEIAVFSGDTVRRDAEGYLYFVGRRDEMIKTSGFRVSPTEVEEAVYASGLVGECAAFGVAHPVLGQAIEVVATAPAGGVLDADALLAECRRRLPAYMVPAAVHEAPAPLPRNANGKIDRQLLASGGTS